jgi:hypothetical protein
MNQGTRGMFSNFMKNPFQFIAQKRGINIPGEYANNPQAAVQYLLNSGQMTPEQLQQLKNKANQMGVNL